MEREEIIEKLKTWNFKEKSKKEFSEIYKISTKTITNYIEKYNIPYEKRTFGVKVNRDRYGKYCLKSSPDNNNAEKSDKNSANLPNESDMSCDKGGGRFHPQLKLDNLNNKKSLACCQ